jgi:hypothetical protein
MTTGIRNSSIQVALATLALFGASFANAATVTYYLNNTNANPYLPDGPNYIQVDITDGVTAGADAAGDSVRFDVTILAAVPPSSGGSYGIDKFFFNTDLVTSTITNANFVLPAGWTGDGAPPPNQGDGYGDFGVSADDTNNPQAPTLTFYLTGIAGDSIANYYALSTGGQTQGHSHFATHVRGFGDQDPAFCDDGFGNDTCVVTSAWFGDSSMVPVVPVPAAVWLLGSAFGLLGFARRKTTD